MISEKTVFILGAGASYPYNYPTGEGLRNIICTGFIRRYEKFLKDDSETERSPFMDHKIAFLNDFRNHFDRSSTPSIDLFLARNPEFSEIGKKAIVLSICDAEHKSRFRRDVDNAHPIRQDWYSLLFERMTNTLTTPDSYNQFRENKVTFITFNYDRSLEYFLHESFVNSFGSIKSSEVPIGGLIPFGFLHVYGVISKLPWQSNNGMEYGTPPKIRSVLEKMTKNISPIYESSGVDLHDLKKEIRGAERIYFLGFGYAKENLDILGIPKVLNNTQKIYGTTLGRTEKEIEGLKRYMRQRSEIEKLDKRNLIFGDVNCYELLREYL
jgi:hypothetical protein